MSELDDDTITWEHEQPVCRVCRMEGEEGNPLFYPCKCRGSIRYVHSPCIEAWQRIRKSRQCELCLHTITFSPTYIPGAPLKLSKGDLLLYAFTRGTSIISRWGMVIFSWGVALPLGTSWSFQYMGAPQSSDSWFGDWQVGLALCGIILSLGLVALCFRDTLVGDNPPEQFHEGVAGQGQPNDDNLHIHEEREFNLEHFFGTQDGPILDAPMNASFVLLFNSAVLAFGVSIPSLLGWVALESGFKVPETPLGSFGDQLLVGYSLTGILFVSLIAVYWRERFDPALRILGMVFKATFFLTIELVGFPIGLGACLEYFTRFIRGDPASYFEASLGVQLFTNAAMGIFFMLCASETTAQLFKVVRPEVLSRFLRNPMDENFDPFQEMLDAPFFKHVRHLTLNASLYLALVVWLLYFPLKMLCKMSLFCPLQAFDSSSAYMPLDFISYYVLLPSLLRYIYAFAVHYGPSVISVVFSITSTCCGLYGYLMAASPTKQEATDIPHFKWKLLFILFLNWIAYCTGFLVLTLSSLSVGVASLTMLGSTFQNSGIHSFLLGLSAIIFAISSWKNPPCLDYRIDTALVFGFKYVFLPILLGVYISLVSIIPFTAPLNQTSFIQVTNVWFYGAILVRFGIKLAEAGVIMPNEEFVRAVKLEMGAWRWIQVLALPVTAFLMNSIVVPGTIIYTNQIPPLWALFFYRVSFFGLVILFIGKLLLTFIHKWVATLQQVVFEEKYIDGQSLVNYEDDN